MLGVIVLLVLTYISIYNTLVRMNEGVNGGWANVETQYQRRFDLIPNLVNSVKGAMGQEQKIFNEIAEARTRYSGAGSVNEKVAAANQVESALSRLLVIMENGYGKKTKISEYKTQKRAGSGSFPRKFEKDK